MEQKQVVESIISDVKPSHGVVVKRLTGERIRFECKGKEGLLVEVWTDLLGRYHGHGMDYKDGIYSKEFELKETGFFRATIRWRAPKSKHWEWYEASEDNFAEIQVDPDYIRKSVVYNAFIRFYGHKKITRKGMVEFGQSGTFDDLKKRLDELKEMGVKILYLNPIHPIGELYRHHNPHDHYPSYMQPGCPYSIKDYKAIDPEVAIDKDHSQSPYSSLSEPIKEFREMVKEAHKRGIKVYMDLVFNHTSHDFILQRLHPEWFLYKENIKSLEEPYIYPEEIKQGKPWGDAKHTFCAYDHGYWWDDVAQLNWEYKIPKASNEPPKNPTLKEMHEYFKSIPKFWIKHVGIDGFRCDVAYKVPPSFWKECIHEARAYAKKTKANKSKDVVFIAESYVDDLKELLEAGFTATYGDYSNKLYSPLTLKGYLDYMYNISGEFFPEGSQFFMFPECHDFVRHTKKLLGSLSQDEVLGSRANKSRWLLTAMLPGIPMIFNGFEKLEWQQVNLFSYSDIDWESDKDLKEFIIKVNKIRNKHEALQTGTYEYVPSNQGLNEAAQLFSFTRMKGEEKFLVTTNMDVNNTAIANIYLPDSLGLDFNNEYKLKDLMSKKTYTRKGKEVLILLGPGDSHVFKVSQ